MISCAAFRFCGLIRHSHPDSTFVNIVMTTFKIKFGASVFLLPFLAFATLAFASKSVQCAPALGAPRVIKTFALSEEVDAFVPSPKRDEVAVLNKSGKLRQISLLQSTTGKKIWSQSIPDNRTYSISFSSDARLLAVAGVQVGADMRERGSWVTNRGSIRLFHAQSGRLVRTLTILRRGLVHSLALSPRAPVLAVGGHSWIDFWNYETGKMLGTVKATGEVTSLDFSPDGRMLASAALWSGPTLWNVATRRRIVDLPYQGGQTFGVAFSPDGKSLALAGNSFTSLYNVGNRKLRWKKEKNYGFQPSYRSPAGSLHVLSGQRFVAVSGSVSALLDFKTGTEKYKIEGTTQLKPGKAGQLWGMQMRWDEEMQSDAPPSLVVWPKPQ